jgi:hypothetical protein
VFGFIKKGIGKLAKGVASKLTGGASDHVLKALKSLGTAKKTLTTHRKARAAEALLFKYGVPKVRHSTVIGAAAAGVGTPGTYGRTTTRRRTRRRPGARPGIAEDGLAVQPRPRRRARATKAVKRAPRRRTAQPSTGARRPPRGGLDFRAMSRDWNAAGKPGTWQEWIRSNPRRNA